MKPYRILVTGSRDWDDSDRVWLELGNAVGVVDIAREIVIVSGACPRGADAIAEQWGRKYGATVERHPANWRPNGVLDKSAGYRRNAEMVRLGADVCLAFIRNNSRGASHTARLAEQAGIPTRRFTA